MAWFRNLFRKGKTTMKKTLAIVLALVMVLAMIPAMSAETTQIKDISNKSYYMGVQNVQTGTEALQTTGWTTSKVNTIEYKYNYEAQAADVTGKWTDDTKMAMVCVMGFDADFTSAAKIYIDGKELNLDEYPIYAAFDAFDAANKAVAFPVELTKAGYTDSYLVQVKETVNNVEITETAKVSVKLVNTASYKGAEKATVTNIVSKTEDMSAYIVGDKIYFDFINDAALATAEVTFADENGKAFTAITYAYNPKIKAADGSYYVDTTVVSTVGAGEKKLDKSAVKFDFNADGKTIKFVLETKAANYETKDYTIKVREDIKPEDPKGIYFAETTKTIAMGESYAPVVMGVKTGKPVAATLHLGDKTDEEVIDIIKDGTAVIGTREGVAYITASYNLPGTSDKAEYVSSSMKIVVTLPGESIPELDPAAEVYYVTCRALNVRAGAGTSYKKVDLIHRGDAVKVVELKNGWAKLDDGTYVCAKYISK